MIMPANTNPSPSVPQPVGAPLTRAAIFLVVTVNPGAAAETAALLRRLVGEHGDMDRRVFEALELQPRILRALFAVIVFQGARVGARGEEFFGHLALRKADSALRDLAHEHVGQSLAHLEVPISSVAGTDRLKTKLG